ncbi:MBL fold metallo-hydrolase [Candidatus Pacearchaeota archaeon]|nr:MBL fold metallo-hydrolase [Candidatus Pacearchaeota archaeon]
MKFSCLSSGSSGNCFFLEDSDGKSILIDAGISCSSILNLLESIDKKPESISALFITHEHTDHIRGAEVFSKKFNLPVYLTKKTSEQIYSFSNLIPVKNNFSEKFGNLEVEFFSKSHDTPDPVSVRVHEKGKTLGVITDIGFACKNVLETIEMSDSLILEANHDTKMLTNGPYPFFLKKRILSDKGHISNLNSALAVLEYSNKKLKNIALSHLSEQNNTPVKAKTTFTNLLKERRDLDVNVFVSSRDKATRLLDV